MGGGGGGDSGYVCIGIVGMCDGEGGMVGVCDGEGGKVGMCEERWVCVRKGGYV